MSFQAADSKLFSGRPAPLNAAPDVRLGDLVRSQKIETARWIIAGYPDDEGVRLNHGRPGAAEGPDVIRQYLYRMTPSPFETSPVEVRVHDIGNLKISEPLVARHESARAESRQHYRADRRWIALGGGHDYAYSDVSAFLDWCKEKGQRGIVLNFDAHLDVREYAESAHSGTGFRRVLDANKDFDFYEIGIQSQCNSRAHIEWARENGAQLIAWDEIELAPRKAEYILERLEPILLRPRPVFLSVDLDAFALPLSAGTSAPSITGFTAETFLPLWETLRSRLDVRGAGFYEHAPAYDPTHSTARLAALLVQRLIGCAPTA